MTEQSKLSRWPGQGDAAPPKLEHALRALRKQDEHTARLARVASRLGPLLDAPPPANSLPTAAPLRHLSRGALASRIGAAFLVMGSAAVWLGRGPAPDAHSSAAPVEVASAVSAPVEQVSPPPEATGSAPALPGGRSASPELAEGAASARPESAPSHSAAAGSASKPHPRATAGATTARGMKSERLRSPAARRAFAARALEQSARREREQATALPAPSPPPRVAAEAEPAAHVPEASELDLLYAARRRVSDNPREALRLLDEHVARFPDGLLVPERELLAIEALRATGKTDAAMQRASAFRAHYPLSIYRRRLEQALEPGQR